MAKTNLVLRSVALLYLVFFIIVPMINPEEIDEAESMHPTLRYAIAAGFIIVTAALGISMIREYFRNKKAGRYSPEGYKDDEELEGVEDTSQNSEDGDDTNEDYDDDEYYDEDYDDEEYEDVENEDDRK